MCRHLRRHFSVLWQIVVFAIRLGILFVTLFLIVVGITNNHLNQLKFLQSQIHMRTHVVLLQWALFLQFLVVQGAGEHEVLDLIRSKLETTAIFVGVPAICCLLTDFLAILYEAFVMQVVVEEGSCDRRSVGETKLFFKHIAHHTLQKVRLVYGLNYLDPVHVPELMHLVNIRVPFAPLDWVV